MYTIKRPLVSIITVVYNDKLGIQTTIESVLQQKSNNIEYLVIDGASTDGTKEIIYNYAAQIDLIISEKDRGIYDAMNKGVLKSKGEWIIFINSGDILEQGILQKINVDLENPNFDIVYGDVNINTNGNVRLDKARKLELINYSFTFCHQSVFTRMNLLKTMPFNLKYDICADYDFYLKCYLSAYNFKYHPLPISTFEFGGVSSGLSNKYILQSFKIVFNNHSSLVNKFRYTFKLLKTFLPVSRS
jgi:glycosyltransferase involved in cell wall biosynthesis